MNNTEKFYKYIALTSASELSLNTAQKATLLTLVLYYQDGEYTPAFKAITALTGCALSRTRSVISELREIGYVVINDGAITFHVI